MNLQPYIKILVNYIFFKTRKYIISYTKIYNHNKCVMVKYIVQYTIETVGTRFSAQAQNVWDTSPVNPVQ